MRRAAVGLLAGGLALLPLPSVTAQTEGPDPAEVGSFGRPFREDGAAYDAASNTFGGARGDTGCLPADENGHRDCLPAGASSNLLADGRILYWNAIEGAEDLQGPAALFGGDLARNDRSRLLQVNPTTPAASQWRVPGNETGYYEGPEPEPPLIPGTDNRNGDPPSDGSLFCSDQEILFDGRVLAAGGTNYYAEPRVDEQTGVIELEGVKHSRVFDPKSNAWKPAAAMSYGRWYPSLVTLPDGKLFVASGVTKLIKPIYPNKPPSESGDNVRQTETYDPAANRWTDNGADAARSLPLFPRLHLLPNGKVYYDAAGQAFNPAGQSHSQALWNVAAVYDPATKAWSDLGVPGIGTATEPGFRGSTFSQMLPLKAPYDRASFLSAGGVLGGSPGSWLPTLTSRINEVTIGADGTESLATYATDTLGRPRWYSSGLVLPTGQVLAFSGADMDEVVSPGHESPIRQVELFTPSADGKGGEWRDVAVASRRRTYHNTAVLLRDGSVLVGGHAPIPHSYGYTQNSPDPAPDVRPASNNFRDASFEIYKPPYLFWGSRPTIGSVPSTLRRGRTLVVPTAQARDISSVVLVRNPSVTHLIDGDQRVVELRVVRRSAGTVTVEIPSSGGVLPPGPYLLFVNKASGKGPIPSVGKQVLVAR